MATYNALNLTGWWNDRMQGDLAEWIRLSAEGGTFARDLAQRDDLIAVIEPGVGKGNAACFIPEMAHVEVNPEVCAPGIAPADMKLDTEVGRLRHSAFSGALAHEAAHARFSSWPIDQTPAMRQIMGAALLLEEARIEKHMVAENPEIRILLRSTMHNIVTVGDGPTDVLSAAHLAALTSARADAGVIDASEITTAQREIESILGLGRFYALRSVWLAALALPAETSQESMIELAERWLAVLKRENDAAAQEMEEIVKFICGMGGGEGEGGEGGSAFAKAMEEIAEAAAAEAKDETERADIRDKVKARKAEVREIEKAEEAAEVFGGENKDGSVGQTNTYSRYTGVTGERPPTAQEQAQANALAAALRKARFRERAVTHVASELPPGRLRSPAAVRRSAQRSMGIPVTATPWKQTVRKHTDEPPLRVGIMCDLSGSMGWAQAIVSSTAWVVANAVHRVEGQSATLGYGVRLYPVVSANEKPSKVRELAAQDGSEEFVGALRAIDGELRLATDPTGARLLVIVSDGHYTASQVERGAPLLRRLQEQGVHILWLGMRGTGGYGADSPPKGVEYVRVDSSNLGREIGNALTRLLKAS